MPSANASVVYREHYPTREQARRSVFDDIEVFCNRERRHSTLGYATPAECERQTTVAELRVHKIGAQDQHPRPYEQPRDGLMLATAEIRYCASDSATWCAARFAFSLVTKRSSVRHAVPLGIPRSAVKSRNFSPLFIPTLPAIWFT